MTTGDTSPMHPTAQQYTHSFTSWPVYVKLEGQPGGGGSFWMKADKLAEFPTSQKVREVAKGVCESMMKGSMLRKKPHLLAQIKHAVKQGVHEIGFDYADRIEPIKDTLMELASKLRRCGMDAEEWPRERGTTLEMIKETATALTALKEEVQARREERQGLALSNDWRTDLEKVLAWAMASGQGKAQGDALLKSWEEQGHILPGVDVQACFRWKGLMAGLDRMEAKLTHLAHNLHKMACAADALEIHHNDPAFTTQNPEELAAEMKREVDELVHALAMRSLLRDAPLAGGLRPF